MTCREKLSIDHPKLVKSSCMGGCFGCPSDYGYGTIPSNCHCDLDEEICYKCWSRGVVEREISSQQVDIIDKLSAIMPEDLL